MNKYILVDREPVPCDNLWEWAAQCESRQWASCVGHTKVDDYTVYTSFLGLDHNFDCFSDIEHVPLVFETMIQSSDEGWLDYQERYATWDEAEAGHARAVEYVQSLVGYET